MLRLKGNVAGLGVAIVVAALAFTAVLVGLAVSAPPAPAPGAIAEPAFDSARGLGAGWRDLGWAPRDVVAGRPASLSFADKGGWILARPGLVGSFGAVLVRYKSPPSFGDFLEVSLAASRPGEFPRVTITADLRRPAPGGFVEALIPLETLDPRGAPFEQIILRARLSVSSERVLIDRIALTAGAAGTGLRVAPAPAQKPGRPARFTVDCRAPGRPISPLIYGAGGGEPSAFTMGIGARRWGGNPSTRYNWQIGNAWNAASDWFFVNVDYTKDPTFTYDKALAESLAHGVPTALTVPMIGWVAKDTRSYAFPVSKFGPQEKVAPENPDMGNGNSKAGIPLAPGPPTQTSVPASPEFIGRWISTIREKDRQRGRTVNMVFLDNEPMLWHVTHRDIHPNPTSYDELLSRSVAYATAVRKADPEVLIAGPAEWGWTGYFYSAVDTVAGVGRAPDRRAHGDVPLLPWYLSRMRAAERKAGLKLLDMVDVHFYPAAGTGEIGVDQGGATDRATNAARIRSTRSLWDPTYHDSSWINDRIELIPRLRRWVEQNAPGLGISLGEYSFGAAQHMSGALAQAEALGRFGTEGLTAAFYWYLPPKDSPTYWAFRAYRNFDGKGGRFLDTSVRVEAEGQRASLFVSRSASSDHLVAVLLNLDPDEPMSAEIDLAKCGAARFAERAFVYTGAPSGFAAAPPSTANGASFARSAPPYSITLLDWAAPARTP